MRTASCCTRLLDRDLRPDAARLAPASPMGPAEREAGWDHLVAVSVGVVMIVESVMVSERGRCWCGSLSFPVGLAV